MLDRTVPPLYHQIEEISIKKASKALLNNGIELYSIRSGTQEVLKFDILFNAGKYFEINNGVSFFAGKLLSEGVPGYTSEQIAATFDSYGALLEIISGPDYLEISLHCLSKHFHKLAALLHRIITEATYPEDEIEIHKNIRARNLEVNNEKTSFVASKLFRENIFGSTHPYGQVLNISDIHNTTRKQIVEFAENHIFSKPFTIFVSGNFGEDIIKLIHDEFGNPAISDAKKVEQPDFSGKNKIIYTEKENSVQTSLRMGTTTIPMTHNDIHGLMVTNEILGGYFGSRLMKNIREDKGLTYGIYSGIANFNHASYFVVSADVKKEFRVEAMDEIVKEIENLQNVPVDKDELETVRNYMLGQLQSSINTPFALISYFKNLYQNNLTYKYYQDYINTIRSITPSEIQSLAKQYMATEHLISIGVG